jgi:hypothetical protein
MKLPDRYKATFQSDSAPRIMSTLDLLTNGLPEPTKKALLTNLKGFYNTQVAKNVKGQVITQMLDAILRTR